MLYNPITDNPRRRGVPAQRQRNGLLGALVDPRHVSSGGTRRQETIPET